MFHITPENRIAVETILLIALSVAAFFVARPVRKVPAQPARKAA
ncbi:MAG: hypothetical protein K0R39_2626 [Symbiobacteriaceae bacterium]|jgi:hypothetical protein|nr:hypothetical protein [Symbiobacteriaceae bacterium]